MDGFTKKYNIGRLVYYEWTGSALGAIEREKQIKAWRRAKKIALLTKMNPTWRDSSKDFDGEAQDSSRVVDASDSAANGNPVADGLTQATGSE
jgi:putative endonuclease